MFEANIKSYICKTVRIGMADSAANEVKGAIYSFTIPFLSPYPFLACLQLLKTCSLQIVAVIKFFLQHFERISQLTRCLLIKSCLSQYLHNAEIAQSTFLTGAKNLLTSSCNRIQYLCKNHSYHQWHLICASLLVYACKRPTEFPYFPFCIFPSPTY